MKTKQLLVARVTLTAGVAMLFLFAGFTPSKPCLCRPNEENIYSFRALKSGKHLSLCAEKGEKYIVYRYGLPNKVELQFPAVPDAASWGKFLYKGYARGGGPANAAMSDQTVSFRNKDAEYTLYDQSGYGEDDRFSREGSVTVAVNGKTIDIKADVSSISGTLQSLTMYPIENHFGE